MAVARFDEVAYCRTAPSSLIQEVQDKSRTVLLPCEGSLKGIHAYPSFGNAIDFFISLISPSGAAFRSENWPITHCRLFFHILRDGDREFALVIVRAAN
jgi:hypothetical protein